MLNLKVKHNYENINQIRDYVWIFFHIIQKLGMKQIILSSACNGSISCRNAVKWAILLFTWKINAFLDYITALNVNTRLQMLQSGKLVERVRQHLQRQQDSQSCKSSLCIRTEGGGKGDSRKK